MYNPPYDPNMQQLRLEKRRVLLEYLRRATLDDYQAMLQAVRKGRNRHHPVRHVGTLFENDEGWYVPLTAIWVPPLHGAHCLKIIVPEGTRAVFENDDPGHNQLFFLDGGWMLPQNTPIPLYQGFH